MSTRALNESEMSTLLASLRLWQRELCRSGLPEWADEYFRDCEPLTIDQIDELCSNYEANQETRRARLLKRNGISVETLTARRADKPLRDSLFDRVFALRMRSFARVVGRAELDMHFSLSKDLIPLKQFLATLREGGPQQVTTLMERGDY